METSISSLLAVTVRPNAVVAFIRISALGRGAAGDTLGCCSVAQTRVGADPHNRL
jgi:hypothetical protein